MLICIVKILKAVDCYAKKKTFDPTEDDTYSFQYFFYYIPYEFFYALVISIKWI